jgi:histone acetyltransferase (RNA polymerase elongator complex component)
MTTVDKTEARLQTHEEVCSIRYEQINARLKRIEGIMMRTAAVMMISMGGTIFAAMWMVK